MTEQPIGSKKKRDIALVLTSFLERGRKYSAQEIEQFIRNNVKPIVLERTGFAPDHIRRAMIENGYVERDGVTNETWVADTFQGPFEIHTPRLALLKDLECSPPETKLACPECGKVMRANTLYAHYKKRHAIPEWWEEVFDRYFGWY
jgi:hypothetical protein